MRLLLLFCTTTPSTYTTTVISIPFLLYRLYNIPFSVYNAFLFFGLRTVKLYVYIYILCVYMCACVLFTFVEGREVETQKRGEVGEVFTSVCLVHCIS